MSHHIIKAAQIEFNEGGNTIWVHGPEGATILRIKSTGKIKVSRECENVCSHSDMIVEGDIEICLVEKKERKKKIDICYQPLSKSF